MRLPLRYQLILAPMGAGGGRACLARDRGFFVGAVREPPARVTGYGANRVTRGDECGAHPPNEDIRLRLLGGHEKIP